MCLLLFPYKTQPKYKLILVANRNEFYNRSTQEAHFWEGNTDVLEGKTLWQVVLGLVSITIVAYMV